MPTTQPHIKPPFNYFGGKANLAVSLAAMIDATPHRNYIEPFFGAGSVLLAKKPSQNEYANDLWSIVIDTWTAIRDDLNKVRGELKQRFSINHQRVFDEARQTVRNASADRFIRAAAFIYTQRNSILAWGERYALITNKPNSDTMWSRLNSNLVSRIKDVRFAEKDIHTFLNYFRNDGADTLMYLDPPYINTFKLAGEQAGGVRKFTEDDLTQMVDTLAAAKYKFILSGFPHDLLAEATDKHGWHSISIDMNAHGRITDSVCGMDVKTEVIISNFQLPDCSQGNILDEVT